MTRELLLGIDLGTTVLKAAAFDAQSGKALADKSIRLPVRTARDGTREQDLAVVDRALAQVASSLAKALGKAWRGVSGVGLAAQGGSAIIVDRCQGRALTPMQLWSDTRPLGLLAEIAARKTRGYWKQLSFLPEPGAGLARMEWLRRKKRRLFQDGNLYCGAGEYVYFQLTGQWRQDAGNALQIGCYDARRGGLTEGPLSLVGVPLSFVAPMRQGHETHTLSAAGARILGLPPGMPVAGPYMDHEAGYVAASGESLRPLQCSLGTAWVGNYTLPRGSPPPSGYNLVLPSPVGPGHLIVRVMLAGNASWDWATRELIWSPRQSLARVEAIFRRQLLPPPGLVALPWLTRPNLLDNVNAGSGAFLGIGTHTTREDLVRAMAACMCFEFTRAFEPVCRPKASRTVSAALLGGGASQGEHFRSLLAELMAPLPVKVVQDQDMAGPRGTLYAFSRRVARCQARAVPRPARRLRAGIQRAYEHYLQTCRTMSRGLGDGGGILLEGCLQESKS